MTGPSPARPVQPQEDADRPEREVPDRRPCSPGTPFEAFPGPALLVARNGVVLSANDLAEPLVRLLQGGATDPLREAVAAALDGKAAQVTPLLLPSGQDPESLGQALDLVALPWADGTAVLLLGRDITLDRSLRGALIESRQRYKDLVEASSDFAWEVDAEGRFVFVSPRGALGYEACELVGRHVRDFLPVPGGEGASPFTTAAPVNQVEVWFRDAAGGTACLSATGLPLHGPDGAWLGARGICRDITEERAREAALARARQRQRLLADILRMAQDKLAPARMLLAAAEALVPALPARGVTIYRRVARGRFVRAARAGDQAPGALLERVLADLGPGRETLEAHDESGCLLARATRCGHEVNGALCLWRAASDPALGADELALLDEVGAQIGVTNRQLSREAEPEELSTTDPLTGLLDRRGFMARLERHFARPDGRSQPAALFRIDLDNFKLVNDRHGREAGDRALLAVSEILRSQARSGDLAARLGGDEFALFCTGMPAEAAERKGRALLAAASALADFTRDPDRRFGLSVGAAVLEPNTSEGLQSLIDRADAAMHAVKHGGKGGLELAVPRQRTRKSADTGGRCGGASAASG